MLIVLLRSTARSLLVPDVWVRPLWYRVDFIDIGSAHGVSPIGKKPGARRYLIRCADGWCETMMRCRRIVVSGFWIVIDRSSIWLAFGANIVIADAGRDGQLVGNSHAITHEEGRHILFAAWHDPRRVIAVIITLVVLLGDVEHRHVANVVVILHTVVQTVIDAAKFEVGGVFRPQYENLNISRHSQCRQERLSHSHQ